MTTLRLTGHDLSIADVVAVARRNAAVALDRAAEHRVAEAAKLVAELASGGAPVYGVNTGFGDLATVRVPMERVRELQLNLVRSHAVGVGDPLPQDVVRAILLLRANTLATGRSGVKVATINLLLDMLDRGVHPVVPQHGSVGASGDLAPLAHAALVLIGEGEAFVDGVRLPGGDALKRKGLSPLELAPKEALALINGTQVMTAIGCLALHDAEVLATSADVVGAMSAEAMRATDAAWDEALHATRPHPGQLAVAANLRALMLGSPNVASHRTNDPRVQDPYSIRCMRIDRMTNGHASGLPAFLSPEPGMNSGFMVAQYTAAALVTENRLRSFPASVESLPTSAGMEDHVSMGTHAAHKLAAVVRNTRDVLAIEALCAAQGLDLLGVTTAPGVEEARHVIRERVAAVARDRVLAPDIVSIADLIAREVLVTGVRARVPDLQ